MATDATGSPTPLGIPKYNTSADAPSGLGFNAAMDSLDALISGRVSKPAGIVSGEFAVWNGSGWDRSSVTRPAVSNVYDRAAATLDVANSATETSIYSKSISANDLSTNRMLRLTLLGDYLHNNVAGDTLTTRIKFGGTTLWAHTSGIGGTISALVEPWHWSISLANIGASNSQMLIGVLTALPTGTAAPTTGIGPATASAITPLTPIAGVQTLATIDTTVAQTLDITVQWSAASVNNSWRRRYGVLELV